MKQWQECLINVDDNYRTTCFHYFMLFWVLTKIEIMEKAIEPHLDWYGGVCLRPWSVFLVNVPGSILFDWDSLALYKKLSPMKDI